MAAWRYDALLTAQVLPLMWHAQAQKRLRSVPPSVVVNGGCVGAPSFLSRLEPPRQPEAMKLPMRVQWPDSQVLFLLLGGNDIFRRAIVTLRRCFGGWEYLYHLYHIIEESSVLPWM